MGTAWTALEHDSRPQRRFWRLATGPLHHRQLKVNWTYHSETMKTFLTFLTAAFLGSFLANEIGLVLPHTVTQCISNGYASQCVTSSQSGHLG